MFTSEARNRLHIHSFISFLPLVAQYICITKQMIFKPLLSNKITNKVTESSTLKFNSYRLFTTDVWRGI